MVWDVSTDFLFRGVSVDRRLWMFARADPGSLERGLICIKVWVVRFADFISFFLNIA